MKIAISKYDIAYFSKTCYLPYREKGDWMFITNPPRNYYILHNMQPEDSNILIQFKNIVLRARWGDTAPPPLSSG